MPVPNVTVSHTISGVGGPTGGGGGGGSAGNYGFAILTPSSGSVTPDIGASGGTFRFLLTLSGTPVTINKPIKTGGIINSGDEFIIYVFQDGTGNRDIPIFVTGTTGSFAVDVSTQQIAGDANTYSVYWLTYLGTRFCLNQETVPTGLSAV